MLAALIATRHTSPPIPPIIFYGNQLVAATTTFLCISLAQQAALLSTSLVISNQLLLSTPGNESVADQLARYYYRIANYLSSNAGLIQMPSNLYLSQQIAGAVAAATTLNTVIQSLPVAPINSVTLADMQRRMGIALRLLHSLAIPITLNYT